MTSDAGCILLIPNRNLISSEDNEAKYFGQIADELVRYSRIRSFIMEPKAYLSFSEVKYNLRDDEIILLQSLLTQDYFEDLVPMTENKYINQNTYETAEPLETQTYSNEITEKKIVKKGNNLCSKPTIGKVAGKWNNKFTPESKELIFTDKPNRCTFDVFMTILEIESKNTGNNYTYNDVKEVLADEYISLYDDNDVSIIEVLKAEGKSTMTKQLQAGQITIDNMIMSDDYYATVLDFWILARRFNVSLIFYSGTKLPENGKPLLVANVNRENTNKYYFIKVPGSRPNIVPKFRLLVSGSPPTALIDTTQLSTTFQSAITRDIPDSNVIQFLQTYEKPKAKPRKKLKVVKKVKEARQLADDMNPAAVKPKKKRGRPKKIGKLKLKIKNTQ